MRNALAIVVVILIITMAAVSVISYDMGSSVNSKSTTVTDVVTQLNYVTTTFDNTVVMLVSQTPQQALTFSVVVQLETLGVLTLETSGSCTVTILPVSATTSTYTEYQFPFLEKTIGNTVYGYFFNETITSYFNATLVTVTLDTQGAVTTYVNGTYYEIPITETTVTAKGNLMQTSTVTPSGTETVIYASSTCPVFTSLG